MQESVLEEELRLMQEFKAKPKRKRELFYDSFDLGLFAQIDKAVWQILKMRITDKLKMIPNFFDRTLDKMWSQAFSEVEWCVFFELNPPYPLCAEIMAEIISYCENTEEFDTFQVWSDMILMYYMDKCNDDKSPQFKAILEYYNFMRSETEKRGLEIIKPWNVNPLERFSKYQQLEQTRIQIERQKQEEIANRPPCPKCGAKGSQIMSYGNSWYCKNCGRKYLKHSTKK